MSDDIKFVEDNNIQWVDNNEQQWWLRLRNLNQIWTDSDYVYIVTVSGLEIVNIQNEKKIAFIDYTINGGFSSVWGNQDKIFLGTIGNESENKVPEGIKYINKTCISGTYDNIGNLYSCLSDFISYPNITHNSINYIHGNDPWLICCTISGVDILNVKDWYRSYTYIEGASRCFMTNAGKFYYTVNTDNLFLKNYFGVTESFLGERITLSENRLTATKSLNGWSYGSVKTKYGVQDSKWYWEFITPNITSGCIVGVALFLADVDTRCGIDSLGWGFHTSGIKYHNNISELYGNPWSYANTIGIALDLDNGKLWFSVDGIWQNGGNPELGTGAAYTNVFGKIYAMISFYYNGQIGEVNFGNSPFVYTPPNGFNVGFGIKTSGAWSMNIVDDRLWDWVKPDYFIVSKADIFPEFTQINDIFITEHTSSNSIDNTIFIATSSGTYAIDEVDMEDLNYIIYSIRDTSIGTNVYHILPGSDPNYLSVWADSSKLYISNQGSLSIVDIDRHTLWDYYDIETKGAAGEIVGIEGDDIVDINIVGGM